MARYKHINTFVEIELWAKEKLDWLRAKITICDLTESGPLSSRLEVTNCGLKILRPPPGRPP